ncbi:PREDICTED: growth-regulating factor 2-like [Camelina sativa]|uniref:Growth-regulating factor n=1 Tax=Camelina sativa TaxID=90675 RepID=A0ABM0TVE1_CAMSA|nr:PREDICTED: growth-regulating factor 2-like [Camelina sativa]
MDIGVHILGSVTSNETPGQKQELRGTKQDRSGFNGDDYYLQRSLKLARTTTTREEEEDNLSSSSSFAASYCKTIPFHQGIPLLRSASPLSSSDSRRQEQMLSFSDKPQALDFTKYVGLDNNCHNKSSLSPFLHQIPPPSYFRNSGGGYGSGGMMMNMSMQGNFTSVKGPFTLTQWAELEQQALIYKYITANVPVPSSLLISIKKSFYPFGSLPPSSFGWGTFHLGFAGGNMDPEPGRCRRTDGKKWRCSRDAVPDQKYCERHINRGRHRSRKPVEVQSGQTATATAASKAVTTTPQQPVAAGNSNNRRASNSNRSLAIGGGQYINPSTESLPNNNRVRNPQIYPSTVNLQPKESPVIHQKQRNNNNNNNPFEFGHISSDSLLNPNADTSKTYGSSYLDFSSNQDKYSGNHNHNSWPEELKSDWTQLSMSMPIASSSSPSSSHNNNNNAQEKTTLSPLRLSREIDLSIQTEETTMEPAAKKVNTWIPISWGNSLGGPLGEVLNSTTNSPTLGSSPTGVLQKSTFCSLSNNSSVSSPIAENNNRNNGDYFHYTTT